jgi:hypothetical protein
MALPCLGQHYGAVERIGGVAVSIDVRSAVDGAPRWM